TDADVIRPPLIRHDLPLFDRLTDFKVIERILIQMPVDDLISTPSGIVKREYECPAESIPAGARRHFSVGNGRDACVVGLREVVCPVVAATIRIGIDTITHEVSLAPRFALTIR